jgi:phenylpyruvate tautomerase
MPTFNIQTNVPLDGVVTSDILKDASKAVARILSKPESYVLISLRGSIPMSFAGTEEPAAYGELISIGGVGPVTNKELSAAISEILESKLSVPPSRFYIKFFDCKRTDMGWNGSTF